MMETLVRYLPSLNEVEITCEVYIDWDDITFPSDNLHVDGIPTTLSAEEIKLILSLKYPELLDAMNWTMSGILSVDVRIWIEIWWVGDDSNDQLVCTFTPTQGTPNWLTKHTAVLYACGGHRSCHYQQFHWPGQGMGDVLDEILQHRRIQDSCTWRGSVSCSNEERLGNGY